jgi:hypothetical protein
MKYPNQPRYISGSNVLEMQTISQILEYSIDLAEEEYVEVTLKNRRGNKGNTKKFFFCIALGKR